MSEDGTLTPYDALAANEPHETELPALVDELYAERLEAAMRDIGYVFSFLCGEKRDEPQIERGKLRDEGNLARMIRLKTDRELRARNRSLFAFPYRSRRVLATHPDFSTLPGMQRIYRLKGRPTLLTENSRRSILSPPDYRRKLELRPKGLNQVDPVEYPQVAAEIGSDLQELSKTIEAEVLNTAERLSRNQTAQEITRTMAGEISRYMTAAAVPKNEKGAGSEHQSAAKVQPEAEASVEEKKQLSSAEIEELLRQCFRDQPLLIPRLATLFSGMKSQDSRIHIYYRFTLASSMKELLTLAEIASPIEEWFLVHGITVQWPDGPQQQRRSELNEHFRKYDYGQTDTDEVVYGRAGLSGLKSVSEISHQVFWLLFWQKMGHNLDAMGERLNFMATPEAKEALISEPGIAEGLDLLASMHIITETSHELAELIKKIGTIDSLKVWWIAEHNTLSLYLMKKYKFYPGNTMYPYDYFHKRILEALMKKHSSSYLHTIQWAKDILHEKFPQESEQLRSVITFVESLTDDPTVSQDQRQGLSEVVTLARKIEAEISLLDPKLEAMERKLSQFMEDGYPVVPTSAVNEEGEIIPEANLPVELEQFVGSRSPKKPSPVSLEDFLSDMGLTGEENATMADEVPTESEMPPSASLQRSEE